MQESQVLTAVAAVSIRTCHECGNAFEVRPWMVRKNYYPCQRCKGRRDRAKAKARGRYKTDAYRERKRVWRQRNRESARLSVRKAAAVRKAAGKRTDSRKYYNPAKAKARNILNRAIRAGEVMRGVCERCGNSKAEGHHPDYSMPLAVEWLCKLCHEAAHHYGHQ